MLDAWTLNRRAAWQARCAAKSPILAGSPSCWETWRSGGRFQRRGETGELPSIRWRRGIPRRRTGADAAGTGNAPDQWCACRTARRQPAASANWLSTVSCGRRRTLQRAAGDVLAEKAARPGRLEIAGQMRVDRASDGATLDLRLDRVGVTSSPVSGCWFPGRQHFPDRGCAAGSRAPGDRCRLRQMAPMGAPRLSTTW